MGEGTHSTVLSSGLYLVSLCLCTVNYSSASQFLSLLSCGTGGQRELELGISLLLGLLGSGDTPASQALAH